MLRKQTAKIANANILDDSKLYLKRAHATLPYLIRQAKAGQTIYYSELAEEVNIPNPRNLNYVLGAIGNALIELSKLTNIHIPPVQCVVINKRDELPGEGIAWFISKENFNKLSKIQKRKIVDAQLAEIFAYPHWNWVLKELGLEPLEIDVRDDMEKAKSYRGGGESEAHKQFKKYIAENPPAIGLHRSIGPGQLEYPLPSADTIDILFSDDNLKIAVEVKSYISDTPDILRGLFQCIKYKSLMQAEQILNNETPNCRAILVLQGKLPEKLRIVKKLLGVEVIEEIKIHS
jgi:hypothetical protein